MVELIRVEPTTSAVQSQKLILFSKDLHIFDAYNNGTLFRSVSPCFAAKLIQIAQYANPSNFYLQAES